MVVSTIKLMKTVDSHSLSLGETAKMKTKGSWEIIWIAVTMGGLLASLIFVYIRADRNPLAQIEFKAKRIAIVNTMRLALAATSEEQNCAVLSTNELDSKTFVHRARLESAAFERGRLELADLILKRGDETETALAHRVDQAFREFQSINDQLSDLTIQSSNRKAYALAFGPTMNLLQALDVELSRLCMANGNSPSERNMEVLKLVSDARLSVLRIQVLLIPHIAEASDQKMDEFETRMAEEDQKIQQGLVSLGLLLSGRASIATITSLHAEFEELKSQIIKLSRENSGIRSVAIALNEKRKAMLACQDALASLEKAITAELIVTTIPAGRSQ